MVRKARVWFDEELAWDSEAAEEDGGVAVQTQTTLLTTLRNGDPVPDPVPSESEEDQETSHAEPLPNSDPKPQTARHLAGADWLTDWTLYLPSQPVKRPKG